MFISLVELGKIIVITVAAGLIFRKALGLHKEFPFWKSILYAGLLTAPAIVLHEIGHKIAAMSFGLTATLDIPWFWLGLGVVLALVNAPFIFFVPAFVAFGGAVTPLQDLIISAAGPLTNLLLYVVAIIVLRVASLKPVWRAVWMIVRKMNGFLFVFNIIPIPGFDGYHLLSALLLLLGIKPLY
jgi:Zn-dependent protease